MASSLQIIGEPEEAKCCSSSVGLNLIDSVDGVEARKFKGRAALITLGCAKNQVDSEVMLGVLRNEGFEIVTDLATADVAIVNTCSFLQSSVKESIDCILEVAEYKKSARLRKLLVAGCLVERYKEDLRKTLPEVDDFITIDDLLKIGSVIDGGVSLALDRAARPYFLYDDTMPRLLSTRSHTAYLKVSEGCNRPCTFCIIPKLRGPMRSRTIDSILRETQLLGDSGVREVNLIAQDLTSFDSNKEGKKLVELLRAMDKQGAVDWIRLLYAYPIGIDDELLDAIVELPHVVEYLDLPLQHSSEAVLARMKRPLGRYSPRRIIEQIRARQSGIHLRTTLIVGFPGETEEDIVDLERFISEGHFTSVGVFTYSNEEGTAAAEMDGQISQSEKNDRRGRIMLAQQKVNTQRMNNFIGQTVDVLVDGLHEDTDLLYTSRSRFQAPDVDGVVLINDATQNLDMEGDSQLELTPGQMGRVEITETAGYDLIGTFLHNRSEV